MIRLVKASALLCVLAVILTSCSVTWDVFTSSLGFESRDYSEEAVIKTYSTDGDLANEISTSVRMLTMNSPAICEFSRAADAIDLFRDSVLNYMLIKNYSRYSGESDALSEAAEIYPELQLTVLIPASEFEQLYYRYFGGAAKISNKSGEYFMYLPKLEAYTALSKPLSDNVDVTVYSLEETEHTYRLRVTLTVDEKTSPAYDMILIKRDDSSFYFRSVAVAP